MNCNRGLPILAMAIIALSITYEVAWGTDINDFRQLRAAVPNWKKNAPDFQLKRYDESISKLVECPDEKFSESASPRLVVELLGKEYELYTIDRGQEKTCLFMVRPLRRPLTVPEASDLKAALIMAPD